jgi:diacylglycerol O-acyltransferase
VPVGTPMWVADTAFDLNFHLRRVRLPEPGTMRQLLDLAQAMALVPLDRTRPPWVGTLVEGLEGGRAAYLLQAQHVLMDGMAVTQLLQRVLSRTREPMVDKPWPDSEPAGDAGRLGVTGQELVRQVKQTPRIAGRLLSMASSGVRHPVGALRYSASLRRVLSPPPPNPSQVLRGGSRRMWRFGMLECSLDELKAAGRAAGGTVNDTFVCALLGGLRRYCAHFGEDLQDVPISMPVSLRRADQAMGGNRFAGAFFAVPSGIADPAERIREMRRRVEAVRSEQALDFINTLTPIINRAPSPVAAGLLASLNSRAVLTTSSWPGVGEDLYMAGAKFERMFVLAPLPGTVLTGAMCTHVGTCCIGINVDGEVFRDSELVWQCMQEGLDEVLALAPRTATGGGRAARAAGNGGSAGKRSARLVE